MRPRLRTNSGARRVCAGSGARIQLRDQSATEGASVMAGIERPTKASIEEQWDLARDDAAEAGVLAAMLLLGKAESKPALTDGDFTNPARLTIWKAMQRLRKAKKPIGDATILIGEIRDMGLFGDARDGAGFVHAYDVAAMFSLLPNAANRDEYAARVREMSARRAALKRAEKELQRSKGDPQ